MTSAEDVGLRMGARSVVDALRKWSRTRFVLRGHDVRDSLISVQQVFEAGWESRGHAGEIKQEIVPDLLNDIEENSNNLFVAPVIPPTPAPPPVPWIMIEEADGSRTLHTTFTMVKDEHPSGKTTVDIRMNMLPGGPFSTAAAIGIAPAVENATVTR